MSKNLQAIQTKNWNIVFVFFIEREVVQNPDLFDPERDELTHRLNLFQGFVAERTIRLGINDDSLQMMESWPQKLVTKPESNLQQKSRGLVRDSQAPPRLSPPI